MDLLPAEMLFEIFKDLSAEDLINLSCVCKSFNAFINNELNLVRKLQMCFRKLNYKDESTLGDRQYTKLCIGFFSTSYHRKLFHSISSRLTTLSFSNIKLKLNILKAILNAAPNVTSINFFKFTLLDAPRVLKKPFPQLDIKSLVCTRCDPGVYRIFNECNIKELTVINDDKDDFYDFRHLTSLLKSQKTLKCIFIEGLFQTNLFIDESLDKVDFHLESFTIINGNFCKTIHLKDFIENHADSLTRLTISDVEYCDFTPSLICLTNLRMFDFSNIFLHNLETLESVEILSIGGQKMNISKGCLSKFPFTKILKLKWMRNEEMLDIMSQNMKELVEVEITEGIVDGLKSKTLKTIVLDNVDRLPLNFFIENDKIEDFTFLNCSFVNDEIIENVVSLKHLSRLTIIRSGNITNNALKLIRNNCKHLEKIVVKENGNHLNWKLMDIMNCKVNIQ
ncbi:CLUMA_CG018074, isoform A [Clunio marinus]|uniref:CLUMA_CG018074, isoform A n=1 Tax=Clunio marinus TaxID=568069 RepID=A0A1J1J261_9DIPT|nr:CLUMA_CG018074, isoform A [Clunio marinus]